METHLEVLSGGLKQMVDLKLVVSSDQRQTIRENLDGIDLTRAGRLFDLISAPICPDLVRAIHTQPTDIIHIHWPNPTAVLAYLFSGHRGRLVFTYHSDIIRQKKMAVAFAPILSRALNKAAAIIVASPNYIDSSTVLRKFRDKCKVIPFGVPADYFDQYNHSEVRNIRRRYGPRLVLGVGRMVYYKGFEYLVRAMSNVNCHLVLIGEGPLRENLRALVSELKLNERVTLLDQVDDLRPYYHAADIFVLSSIARSEAFGIVQLEAMACGTPVINTQLDSGVTFVSPHGISGLTVPPCDSVALSRSINELLDDTALQGKLGIGARNRVLQSFTVDKMVQDTFNLYRDVIEIGSMTNQGK
jgi:rhamnosyl/mannosyltransferase